MMKLFNTCRDFLDIKSPIHFELRERIWKNHAGVHWANIKDGKIIKHIIKVSYNQVTEDRNLETILAHEFVHCWQAEYRPWKKWSHNTAFADTATVLQCYLRDNGFEIQDIFDPTIDVV